jgi:hypothetical protein
MPGELLGTTPPRCAVPAGYHAVHHPPRYQVEPAYPLQEVRRQEVMRAHPARRG